MRRRRRRELALEAHHLVRIVWFAEEFGQSVDGIVSVEA